MSSINRIDDRVNVPVAGSSPAGGAKTNSLERSAFWFILASSNLSTETGQLQWPFSLRQPACLQKAARRELPYSWHASFWASDYRKHFPTILLRRYMLEAIELSVPDLAAFV